MIILVRLLSLRDYRDTRIYFPHKDIYTPVALKRAQEFVSVTFHSYMCSIIIIPCRHEPTPFSRKEIVQAVSSRHLKFFGSELFN